MKFTKMHGLGNDYVYVDVFAEAVDDPVAVAKEISDRHRGVGGDGLILIGPPTPGSGADVRMRMFNADGSESEMCGNGVRCVAKFTIDRGLADEQPLRVETGRGVLRIAWRRGPGGDVVEATVDMGEPEFDPASIPLDERHAEPLGDGLRRLVVDGETLEIVALSMGNPHAVVFVDELPDGDRLRRIGPSVERHPAFPSRVNLHMVRVDSRDAVTMVTWERGSGATQACGTGASAVCVAGALTGRTDRSIVAHLPGGDLRLKWCEPDDHVLMTGPATESFVGEWTPSRSGVEQASCR